MANVKLFDQTGKEVSTVELNDAIFGIEPNESVVFDVVISQRASLRQGTHAVKNRSAVSGGGRKPWRQKGTGRARQGSIRSPQWRGGGVVFGPTPEKNYKLKMNRKVRRLAMKSAYSVVLKDKQLFAVEDFVFELPKTKEFVSLMNAFNVNAKLLVIINEEEGYENLFLAGRNIPGVKIAQATSVSVEDLLHYDVVMMSVDAIKKVEEVLG